MMFDDENPNPGTEEETTEPVETESAPEGTEGDEAGA